MYLNKVMLIGNLTRDPELKSLPSGVKVTSIGLATNRSWKKEDGSKQETTEFNNAVAFGKPAELIAQYCRKGSSLYIDGRLQTRSWDGTDGQKKYRTEIIIENFQFGPRATASGPAESQPRTEKPTFSGDQKELETIEYPSEDINAEDIPF